MYEPWMDNILIFGDIEDYRIEVKDKCKNCIYKRIYLSEVIK